MKQSIEIMCRCNREGSYLVIEKVNLCNHHHTGSQRNKTTKNHPNKFIHECVVIKEM